MAYSKLSKIQIATLILIVVYIIWEINMQQYLSENGLQNTQDNRVDLFLIIPILVVMSAVSIYQTIKSKR